MPTTKDAKYRRAENLIIADVNNLANRTYSFATRIDATIKLLGDTAAAFQDRPDYAESLELLFLSLELTVKRLDQLTEDLDDFSDIVCMKP